MNAINEAMVGQMTRVFTELATRNDCRVVLIRGEGANFSAGGDMGDIATMASADRDERAAAVSEAVENLSRPMSLACADLPQPVVASVRGHAIGVALQLVLMADLVIASQTAKFSLPQLRLGHTPDHGESWALPRKIGLSRALQMCLLAERINAATAEAYGLANWVVADDTLEEQTEETIGRLLSLPPLATKNAKRLMRDGLHRSLPEAMDAEIASIREVAAQHDFLEAVRAYSEKRAPVFKGC
ncbi:enoyl-CoA hydratase/isomerase family protein [Croceicoccus sp. YJ47]|uniref:enoyl-CoA hydratase/isomerase family protein n=1 Tax=Croceicoccus sp. YJ47 TaxID=2798724 RepID=UPI001922318B|nr:enoyl-CoA hydratase-related protein [Croceicoccus sp. YJ47]QQN75290.1 enoyl-CoA hydratase/isomerase family protein [Croceicoccus sp. YJ47]